MKHCKITTFSPYPISKAENIEAGGGRKMLIINPRLQECLGDAGFNKFILIGDSMLTTIYVLHTDHIALSMLRVV